MNDDDPLFIGARRMAPKDHLRMAAKADLGSDEERYLLAAATGEALARIEMHLARIADELARLNGPR
jgi:hypothetical protein